MISRWGLFISILNSLLDIPVSYDVCSSSLLCHQRDYCRPAGVDSIAQYMVTNRTALFRMLHKKCRQQFYPRTNNTVTRLKVPDDKVPWQVVWEEYKPAMYTAPHINGQPWADLDIEDKMFHPKWNEVDGNINRRSYTDVYSIVDKYPLNPMGRTGLRGRGILGRWGPNHAADPVVTRWKRGESHEMELNSDTKKPVLQFVAIQRRDTGEWAIPGGMVDPGEVVTSTLKREFMEEALNVLESNDVEKENSRAMIDKFFDGGEEVYRGYVDDHRNTDNAWMETVAMNFHDESGTSVGSFPLCAGDDAVNVRWMDISKDLSLYASHNDFIARIVAKHNAHW
ncbi:putative nudix hydrolase 6 [Periplaneta americana]|uniref:putative nudix hydrolase 6 n=1 Tax=Periplaneta americana TaxID=6978 RepID=UPI0037E76626